MFIANSISYFTLLYLKNKKFLIPIIYRIKKLRPNDFFIHTIILIPMHNLFINT